MKTFREILCVGLLTILCEGGFCLSALAGSPTEALQRTHTEVLRVLHVQLHQPRPERVQRQEQVQSGIAALRSVQLQHVVSVPYLQG